MAPSAVSKVSPLLFAIIGGCAVEPAQLFPSPEAQARLRAMQCRVFDTDDERRTLRTAIATLQDLGFVIDDGHAALGFVAATKLEGEETTVFVSLRPLGGRRTVVRASVHGPDGGVLDSPELYQAWFTALSKAMFLTAHDIE